MRWRAKLPGFDALEKADRIQKTGNSRGLKSRRQNPVVGRRCFAVEMAASKPGSSGSMRFADEKWKKRNDFND
jgi:hypothetical protein